jgi:hypothetical protein
VGWARYSRSQLSEPWRYQYLSIIVGLWLGCLFIAGAAYVLSSVPSELPTTLAIGKAAGALQPTRSLPSPPPQRADNALFGTEMGPPSVAHPNIVAKDDLATAAIAIPPSPPQKSTPSIPAIAEMPKHTEDAPAAPTEAMEKTPPAILGAPTQPDAPAPEAQLSEADRALFAQRGTELLAAGDIASARLFFERAANAGDLRSALGMAKSFDPVELAKAGARGLKGDQAEADYWYQRARSLPANSNSRPSEGKSP